MSTTPLFKLNTNAVIPAIAHGAYAGRDREQLYKAKAWLTTALSAGYRHFDAAWIYATEPILGEVIRESGVPREELFITTKLPWHHVHKVEESINQSLERLGVDYVDLYLMHWPQPAEFHSDEDYLPLTEAGDLEVDDSITFNEVWAAMEKLVPTGKVKAIGVSNFSIKTLEQLLEKAKIVPAANQVELSPILAQSDLVDFCRSKGIVIEAYGATGYAGVTEQPLIVELAAKYKCTPNQVTLGWHVARGVIPVVVSTNVHRQKENLQFPVLEKEDVDKVTSLDRNERQVNKPNDNGKVWGWTVNSIVDSESNNLYESLLNFIDICGYTARRTTHALRRRIDRFAAVIT
ncbi:hypothetical protein EW146_g1432 [Bondarzewia mesenterica]|uniref:NADP-dependent oxidoreductase domain-containing protein n=1 Tax=Bondarzewia mesenterica TaxID=1095465 RepID=A0A4S4M3R1_9AGAM|nr:hypothetical protein EW146_g1432 [Bondarzewia mesenterica]